jgi:predicted molibdopterin-dependent oxidoreductase YjgC
MQRGPRGSAEPDSLRIDMHGSLRRGRKVSFTVDGSKYDGYAGETVAAALIAAGRPTLRRSDRFGAGRGLYCGIGVCNECTVGVEGRNVLACMTYVSDGTVITTVAPRGHTDLWNL